MNKWIVWLIIAFVVFLFARKKHNALKIHNNSVICFSGGLGSGKTFMAVTYAVKLYRRQMFWYRLKLRPYHPYIVSNIPIRVGKKEWACVLTREHLLMKVALPPQAIVLIDELGDFADQYSHDNPNIMGNFTELVRFYRHYIDGKFIFTDQSLLNVIFSVKRRTIINYCLESFRKGLILPTYTINVAVLRVMDGEVVNTNPIGDKRQKIDYFYGLIPVWRRWRSYDSRCYSDNYNPPKAFDSRLKWGAYKTSYVIDMSCSEDEAKEFKSLRKNVK